MSFRIEDILKKDDVDKQSLVQENLKTCNSKRHDNNNNAEKILNNNHCFKDVRSIHGNCVENCDERKFSISDINCFSKRLISNNLNNSLSESYYRRTPDLFYYSNGTNSVNYFQPYSYHQNVYNSNYLYKHNMPYSNNSSIYYTHFSKRRSQVRFSPKQTDILESKFISHKYLSPEDRRILADSLKLSDRQVKTWFQNRRAKWRRNSVVQTRESPSDITNIKTQI